jgi:transposase
VMEATGIYYESLAHYLHGLKFQVSVVLPNMVKHFGKSLNIKSKTDIIDAAMIGRMAVERNLTTWKPPTKVMKELRDLTRLYTDLQGQKTVFTNRLHSMQAGHEPSDHIVKSTKSIIAKFDLEIKNCLKAIDKLITQDEELYRKFTNLLTIKGVGVITAAIIIAETFGFELFSNCRQLTSYAGYDVIERLSGTSVKGKPHISKKGNSRIRAALYCPAIVAGTHSPRFKAIYTRINERRPSKKIGQVALQRRLLVLMYSMWKSNTPYDEEKNSGNQETGALLRNKKEADRTSLSAQDELPLNQSTEALLRQTKLG